MSDHAMSDHGLQTAARAVRAMHSLAGDLAEARREMAALRRENSELRAEIERLGARMKLEQPEPAALRVRPEARRAAGRRAASSA